MPRYPLKSQHPPLTNVAIIAMIAGMMEPAHTIIKICGGFGAVARMTGRSEVRVRRWTYPKARGGSDGLIPADCQQQLLAVARQRGIDLRPEHFFPDRRATASA